MPSLLFSQEPWSTFAGWIVHLDALGVLTLDKADAVMPILSFLKKTCGTRRRAVSTTHHRVRIRSWATRTRAGATQRARERTTSRIMVRKRREPSSSEVLVPGSGGRQKLREEEREWFHKMHVSMPLTSEEGETRILLRLSGSNSYSNGFLATMHSFASGSTACARTAVDDGLLDRVVDYESRWRMYMFLFFKALLEFALRANESGFSLCRDRFL